MAIKVDNKLIIMTVTTVLSTIGAYKMGLMDWIFKKNGKSKMSSDGK
uniref:Uncharacterized protein n=1 Tax=Onchocerca volvulus TaxID=6282 RepID=A0A8R1TX57_ONCVO